MPVGIIDVGSNTVRLHVSRAAVRSSTARRPCSGSASRSSASARFPRRSWSRRPTPSGSSSAIARTHGADRLEVLVASPGRQAANGEELLARLAVASGVPVRLLSAQEEGRLAFVGALTATRRGTAQAGRGMRRRRRLLAGRGRHPAPGDRVGAVDRHRLDPAHEPAARRRPARRGSRSRRRAPRSSACSRDSCRPRPSSPWPSAEAHAHCARSSGPTWERRRSRRRRGSSPERPRTRSRRATGSTSNGCSRSPPAR